MSREESEEPRATIGSLQLNEIAEDAMNEDRSSPTHPRRAD